MGIYIAILRFANAMAANHEKNDEDYPTLTEGFDQHLKLHKDVEDSDLPTNSDELQAKIKKGIKELEKDTLLVSQLGVFSSNETLEELSTSSIKFLLLPVLLGSLTLKRTDIERTEILRLANIYFRDFIERCRLYQITDVKLPEEKNFEEDDDSAAVALPPKRGMPTPDELAKMGQQREAKLNRFKEKKTLGEKLINLKKDLANPSHDEEVLRNYHITMLKKFVCDSCDELDSLTMERDMLAQMAAMKRQGKLPEKQPEHKSQPLRPILITKDALQKQVYGMGYPSLPIYSIEEFYDQRVKDGWFPDPNAKKDKVCLPNIAKADGGDEMDPADVEEVVKEYAEERDDPEKLAKDRARDDWKDNHKTGWGNTYNRS